MARSKKFIQEAINPEHKGALRKKMGIKKGKTIPMGDLKKEAKHAKSPLTRKEANLAITLKGLAKAKRKKANSY